MCWPSAYLRDDHALMPFCRLIFRFQVLQRAARRLPKAVSGNARRRGETAHCARGEIVVTDARTGFVIRHRRRRPTLAARTRLIWRDDCARIIGLAAPSPARHFVFLDKPYTVKLTARRQNWFKGGGCLQTLQIGRSRLLIYYAQKVIVGTCRKLRTFNEPNCLANEMSRRLLLDRVEEAWP